MAERKKRTSKTKSMTQAAKAPDQAKYEAMFLFPPPGTFAALGGREGIARLVDGLYDRIETDPVLRPAFSREGALWAVEEPGTVRRWDTSTGQPVSSAFLSDLETLWSFSSDARSRGPRPRSNGISASSCARHLATASLVSAGNSDRSFTSTEIA